jgi:hypothetical protein
VSCSRYSTDSRQATGLRSFVFPRRYPLPAYLSRCVLAQAVLCLLLGTTLPAKANSVTVTGNGYAGNDMDGLRLTAGIFSASSAAPDGRDDLGQGTVGLPITLKWGSFAFPGPGFTSVSLGNQFTDILTGTIILHRNLHGSRVCSIYRHFHRSGRCVRSAAGLSGPYTGPRFLYPRSPHGDLTL